jgi:lipid-A-disaccharide synthase-like uncharacterized protein
VNAETLYNIAGAVGAFLILFGFYRTSIGKWKNKSFWYELDNLIGALLLVIYQLHHSAVISVIVNIVWAIIAFTGLTSFAQRYTRQAKKQKSKRKK